MSAAAIPVRHRSPGEAAVRCHRFLDAALAVADLWDWDARSIRAAAALDRAIHQEAPGRAPERCAGALLYALGRACGRHVATGIKRAATEDDAPEDLNGPQISPAGRADAPPPAP